MGCNSSKQAAAATDGGGFPDESDKKGVDIQYESRTDQAKKEAQAKKQEEKISQNTSPTKKTEPSPTKAATSPPPETKTASPPPKPTTPSNSDNKAASPPPADAPATEEPEAGKKKKKKKQSTAPNERKSYERTDKIYKVLVKAQTAPAEEKVRLWQRVIDLCDKEPGSACYQNPNTRSTPLHMAVRLIDSDDGTTDGLQSVIVALIEAHPSAMGVRDSGGNLPLHYAVAPTTHFVEDTVKEHPKMGQWQIRTKILRLFVRCDAERSKAYLSQNDVVYESGDATGGCSPLYRALQTLPDDFHPKGSTADYIEIIHQAQPGMVGVGNASDGDKPLGLLYRRFTRQFDTSEKFFAGDNSRPQVVKHRQDYKTAAGNTWKIIELLLRPHNATGNWHIVHRAVQVETPPDLLRYIVETNPQDLTQKDQKGNLPLHYAAASKPAAGDKTGSFPEFYVKYVVDELLYKFPEGATIPDGYGSFPLGLAIESGKKWIGGGIKSLYEAHPDALYSTDTNNDNLISVLSIIESEGLIDDGSDSDDSSKEEKEKPKKSAIKEEHHDAIMLVQRPDVDVSEVVTSMWAHEEDAGIQMLGCVAIANKAAAAEGEGGKLRIALTAVAAVVNAMKAHPNEMIVQEKACQALNAMAVADGKREVSLVASGAIAAIVGAMQAHLGDAGVQEEGCAALATIVSCGGAERATVVGSVSGVTAIVNAIAAHPEVVGVQKHGCQALKELTEYPDAHLPELPRSHTAPWLEAAKKKFPRECGETASAVLSRLI